MRCVTLAIISTERRRSSNRPSAPRPASSPDRRIPISAHPDDVHFWDDTETDRMSGQPKTVLGLVPENTAFVVY